MIVVYLQRPSWILHIGISSPRICWQLTDYTLCACCYIGGEFIDTMEKNSFPAHLLIGLHIRLAHGNTGGVHDCLQHGNYCTQYHLFFLKVSVIWWMHCSASVHLVYEIWKLLQIINRLSFYFWAQEIVLGILVLLSIYMHILNSFFSFLTYHSKPMFYHYFLPKICPEMLH